MLVGFQDDWLGDHDIAETEWIREPRAAWPALARGRRRRRRRPGPLDVGRRRPRRSRGTVVSLPIGVAAGSIGATPAWWLEGARRLEPPAIRRCGRGTTSLVVATRRCRSSSSGRSSARPPGQTSTIRLGTFVTNVMNRHPSVVARMASTLQGASDGRFTLGIGVGGNAAETSRLWDPVSRYCRACGSARGGRRGHPRALDRRSRDAPRLVLPARGRARLPGRGASTRLLIGAASPRGLQIAAHSADGWAAEIDDFERLLPTYLEALAANGKSRADAWIAVGFGSGKAGQDALVDSPWVASPRATWARYAAMGVDEAIVTARTTADVDRLVPFSGPHDRPGRHRNRRRRRHQ